MSKLSSQCYVNTYSFVDWGGHIRCEQIAWLWQRKVLENVVVTWRWSGRKWQWNLTTAVLSNIQTDEWGGREGGVLEKYNFRCIWLYFLHLQDFAAGLAVLQRGRWIYVQLLICTENGSLARSWVTRCSHVGKVPNKMENLCTSTNISSQALAGTK